MTNRQRLISDCDKLWSQAVKKRCHHCDERETDKILQELFEYIKAAEGQ